MKPQVLFVDDDIDLLENAEILLKSDFYVTTAQSVVEARAVLRRGSKDLDAIIVDLNFEGQAEDGLALIDFALAHDSTLPIVVLSGDKKLQRAIEATRRPLLDFIVKDGDYFQNGTLKLVLGRAVERRRQEKLTRQKEITFLTNSTLMLDMIKNVDRVIESGVDCPILINGESGTGKEVLANYVAARSKLKMVSVNMANIPRETAESVLFGHMRGAFTGANENRIGLIEQAHGGIFFLDEIGECSSEIQAKLLRVLQQKEILPLGGTKSRKLDVRFVAATNRNLSEMVKRNLFRFDLEQRLNTLTFEIPPLRRRPEDILLFATKFIEVYGRDLKLHLNPDALDELYEHAWPGNVRELENVIQRIVIFNQTGTISKKDVQEALSLKCTEPTARTSLQAAQDETLGQEILRALQIESGNRDRAAKRLGINRSTLFRYINKLGISEHVAALCVSLRRAGS